MAYKYQPTSPGGGDMRLGDMLVVVHDFDARSTDELTLRKGEKISLVELDDGFGDGWFLGKHLSRGNMGLFPGVYTQKMPGWSSAVRTSGPSVRASLPSEPEIFPQSSLNPHLLSSASLPTLKEEASAVSEKKGAGDLAAAQEMTQVKPSPSSSQPPQAISTQVPRSISQTINDSKSGEDSPVMNQTLSVINEHITNLGTPRHSLVGHDARLMGDSASEYSTTLSRMSYVAGPETDEEEEELLNPGSVKSWSAIETATYLRQIGVDSKHCDIFEEQEITGDVLLEMDQEFIHMKEYDFGVMGRRLKTWHKIRRFQDEVKGNKKSRRRSVSYASTLSDATDDREMRMSAKSSPIPPLPGMLDQTDRRFQGDSYEGVQREHVPAPLQTASMSAGRRYASAGSPLAPLRTNAQDSPTRAATGSSSEKNHSRRHSSLEIALGPIIETKNKTVGLFGRSAAHKKKGSFDRNWSMADPNPSHGHPEVPNSLDQKLAMDDLNVTTSNQQAMVDLDRGYFSGPETEAGKSRNILRKRDGGSAHSRHSSFVENQKRELAAQKRQSRIGSADSIRDMVPAVASPASSAYHSRSIRSRFRSASARSATVSSPGGGMSPTVTNLEFDRSPATSTATSITSPRSEIDGAKVSPHASVSGKQSSKQRRFGLRNISDTVNGHDKNLISSPTSIPSSLKDSPIDSPSRAGSSTPSLTSRSLESDRPDGSLTDGKVPRLLAPPAVPRSKTKTKKETSAYQKGLLKRTPAESLVDCDYSGWMKKKSSSLMTTWKPRLFYLKGRRLAYYYSEDDTEERGIIDISSHKVLKADHDPLNTLHASITGSTSTPIAQSPPGTSKTSPTTTRKSSSSISPFFFKLIPPKAGLSRAVQFTKPTIHYFQVDSVHEGRRWMAAMMKATIEYDPTLGLETTNKQKTISLAKARERKERPPALQGDDIDGKEGEKDAATPKRDEAGLMIRGLSFEDRKNAMAANSTTSLHKKGNSGGESGQEKSLSVSRSRAASETTSHRTSDKALKTG